LVLNNRPDLTGDIATMRTPDRKAKACGLVRADRLRSILRYMLTTGVSFAARIRSLSRVHRDHPYVLRVNENEYSIDYEPLNQQPHYLGNSNWRGQSGFRLTT